MEFFNQVKESVIDFRFYKSIKDNRFAKTFLYLLLILLIIHSMITVRNFLLVKNTMEQASFQLSESMPNFELKNGKFTFEGEMPYYISKSANELFVIDTTGAVSPNELNGVMTGILITQDKLYLKNNLQFQTINLADLGSMELNKQKLINFLPKLSWLVLIAMIVGFIFALGWKLLNAVLLALIGVMINTVYKTDLKFGHMFNFSVYALTLPMIIKLAVDISGYVVPFFFVIYWTISIIYMILAIKAYKEGGDAENTDLI